MIGNTFGKLIILSEADKKGKFRYWNCICECGKELPVREHNLKNGLSKSCGCERHNKLIKRNTKHGLSNTPLYRSWKSMKQRASNRDSCEVDYRWSTFQGFMFHPMKDGSNWTKETNCICRNEDSGNYSPENSRWDSKGNNVKEKFNKKTLVRDTWLAETFEFESMTSAAKFINSTQARISKATRNNKIYKGRYWITMKGKENEA